MLSTRITEMLVLEVYVLPGLLPTTSHNKIEADT